VAKEEIVFASVKDKWSFVVWKCTEELFYFYEGKVKQSADKGSAVRFYSKNQFWASSFC